MLDFWEMYYDLELERLINEGVDDHEPLDGRWDRPLEDSRGGNVYRFNVSGDSCGSPNRPCYQVNVSGSAENGVSISFSRDGSYSDEHRGVGMEVFRGVLKGLGEYITSQKPVSLTWSAVTKSVPHPVTGKITNPEARAHVYEAWALRHLFPDKYVGMDGKWIRRDVYDNDYVTKGFPPVPEMDLSNPGSKRKAHEEMVKKAHENRAEIHRLEREREEAEERRQREERAAREAEQRRQREEAEARRQEMLQQHIQDETKNPEGIREDDVVYIVDPNSGEWGLENKVGKVEGFQFGNYRYSSSDESEPLHAVVRFSTDEESTSFDGRREYIAVSRLKKETPQSRTDRERRRQERIQQALADPEKNPHGIQQGDEIISWMPESPGSKQNGLMGKVREIDVDRGSSVSAKVDWNEESIAALTSERYNRHPNEMSVNVTSLRKATPEQVAEIKRIMREHEVEERVGTARERWNSRTAAAAQAEEEPQTSAEIEELVNHPANPQHLRPGDYVKLRNPPQWGRSARRNSFSGILTDLHKNYWSEDKIGGTVKFHGSTARRGHHVYDIATELERDESEDARAIQARSQQRQQRAQRTVSNTGGHQIGDTVTVVSGMHRNKTGRIVNFRMSGANMMATVAPMDGADFNVRVSALQPPTPQAPPAVENFSFSDYLMYLESHISRELAG